MRSPVLGACTKCMLIAAAIVGCVAAVTTFVVAQGSLALYRRQM